MAIILSIIMCVFLISGLQTTYSISEYILASGNDCKSTIVTEDSVLVKSHVGASMYGGLTSYEANTNCEMTFKVQKDKKVLVLFPFFDLQTPSGVDCMDRLEFYDVTDSLTTYSYTTVVPTAVSASTDITTSSNFTVADQATTTDFQTTDTITTDTPTTDTPTTDTPLTASTDNVTQVTPSQNATTLDNTSVTSDGATSEPGDFQTICTNQTSYVSLTNQLRIRFISDATIQKKGFKLVLTSFHEGKCSDDEFQCDTSRCISSTLKCDGTMHCVDGADEDINVTFCSLDQDDATNSSSIGSLAVLAISLVVAIIAIALICVFIFWKYIKGDATCNSEVEPEEPMPEVVVKNELPMHTPKKKKHVTVGGATTGEKHQKLDSDSKHKPKEKIKKVRQNPSDKDW